MSEEKITLAQLGSYDQRIRELLGNEFNKIVVETADWGTRIGVSVQVGASSDPDCVRTNVLDPDPDRAAEALLLWKTTL